MGQAGVDLPCPPIMPPFFRSAESPEVLSCTPVVHQSGQPSTRFREYPGDGTCFERVQYGCREPFTVLKSPHSGCPNSCASMPVALKFVPPPEVASI